MSVTADFWNAKRLAADLPVSNTCHPVLQELEVAVSLALFSSRMAEMGPAIGAVLDSLPDALTSSASAITIFSAAVEAAAAASVNASAAHRVAQDANVRRWCQTLRSRSPITPA